MVSICKRDSIQSIILFAYLLVYTFSYVIAGEGNMIVVSLIKFSLLFLFLIVSYWSQNTNNIKQYKAILTLLVCFVVLQVVFLDNINSIKVLGVNLIIFIIFFKWSNEKLFRVCAWGLKLLAVITAISVVSLAITFGEIIYYREDALIDKSFMTAIFSMSFVYCLTEILFHKKVKTNLVILLFVFCVDLLLVQSKISLFVLVVVCVISIILKKISIRKSIVYTSIAILVLGTVSFFLPKDSEALDPVKDAANRAIGFQIFEIKRINMKSDTYDIRSDIWSYCLTDLFPNHPVLGIGLGNYSEFSKKAPSSINDIGETESSLLAIITEGGIVYFILMVSFFWVTIRHIYLQYKKNHSYISFTGICLFISYAVMLIGNDFLDSMFWLQTGLMIGVLSPNRHINHQYYNYNVRLS